MINTSNSLCSNPLSILEREILVYTSVQKDFINKSFYDISICRCIAQGTITEEVAGQILEMYRPYKSLMEELEKQGNKAIFIPITFEDNKVIEAKDVVIQLKYTNCDLRLHSNKYKNLYFNADVIKDMEDKELKLYTDSVNLFNYRYIKCLLDSIVNSVVILNTNELLSLVSKCINIDLLHSLYTDGCNKYTNNILVGTDINKTKTWILWFDIIDKLNNIITAITIKYDMYEESRQALNILHRDASDIKQYSNSKEFVISKTLNTETREKVDKFIDFYNDIILYLHSYIIENNQEV